MLVDCHCHLGFPEFDVDRDDVVKRAYDLLIVSSCVDPEKYGFELSLSEKYKNVYCTLGLSASETDELKFRKAINLIEDNREKIVGVGEIGLDHYWVKDKSEQEKEELHYSEFLEFAKRLNLPVVIHSRDAEKKTIDILEEYNTPALLHCFSGEIAEAIRAVGMGCLISIPANVVCGKKRQALVEALPLDALVLESDAPYLSPERGMRNEPANIRHSLGKIAEIKNVTAEEVERVTTENALKFFRL